ncbi:hypothetical protein [Saccharothrix australiensis]|uniref:Tetratricopeptide repeat protein n=1 Tax=Saccharothrix australiensis TaxID=2072 RepID=A0A495W0Y5_9PSEU|nr:hypothetical protein [Saccharothrix australiensis]RKT55361.1 hypothetical protein C8E97_4026 [Saccharothrix australiensis]
MTTWNSAAGETIAALVQAGVVTGGVHLHDGPAHRPVPHNLPPTTHRFTGRAEESAELTRLARARDGGRTCVVDGPPGIGKTAFALRWGDSARDLFPDGQVYVDLRGFDQRRPPVTPEDAVRLALDALHVPTRSVPADPDGRLVLFRSLVDGRRLLFVVDNARDSDQVRPLLPRSPGAFTVVTSRHRLDGLHLHHGAERVVLRPLSDEDAVLLLRRHLGGERVAAERPAVERAVAACAGHPLALSVIAARAALDAAHPLSAVVAELEDRHAALDALRMTDAVDFRAVLALSYDHLPAEPAAAFRALALHPGTSIGVSAAAAMTGSDVPGARRVLAELDRRHLLEPVSPTGFGFHHLTHAYAGERAHLSDTPAHRSATVRALLNHLLHAANRADRLINDHRRPVDLEPCARPDLLVDPADRAEAIAWFAAEYDNVLAAACAAAADDLHPYTWQLPWVLSNFAYLTARWQDWIDTHVRAVAATRRLGERAVEARLLQSLARAESESGAHADAVGHYRAALDLLAGSDDVGGRANALNGLGGVLLRGGAHARASEAARQALDLYAALGDETGVASTHGLLGRVSLAAGRPADAARHHGLARDWYERSGNLYGLAHTADCLAGLDLAAGDRARAARHLRTAVELHHRVGDLRHATASCRKLRALLLSGPLPAAVAHRLDRAVALLEDRAPTTLADLLALIAVPGGEE